MAELKLSNKEFEAVYTLAKKYEEEAPESDEEYYNDYYDSYEEPITKKVISSILRKISKTMSNNSLNKINKGFLRKKYHTFNNHVDGSVYAVIEKAFESLKRVEITYFSMESAEFNTRKIDVYYKSRRYVIGYCHLRKEIRKFRASRIASAKLMNESYHIPPSFDKNNY